MKKFAIFTLSLVLCGVFFGGCRRNVGTDATKMTTVPTTQSTTAATQAPMPTVAPTVPTATDGETRPMDGILEDTGNAADGARRPPMHRPMPHD